eukprot:4440408-Pleurochrysis_carterae.AAC.5
MTAQEVERVLLDQGVQGSSDSERRKGAFARKAARCVRASASAFARVCVLEESRFMFGARMWASRTSSHFARRQRN